MIALTQEILTSANFPRTNVSTTIVRFNTAQRALRAGRSLESRRLGGGIDVVVELDSDRLFDILVQGMVGSCKNDVATE